MADPQKDFIVRTKTKFMNIKSVLIPVAAFAVTVSGVSAFNSDLLERAGLTEEQISDLLAMKEFVEICHE